jgi:SAM-dependent methyltransferase
LADASLCALCGGDRALPLYEKRGFVLVRCSSCGLVFVRDPPLPEQLAHLYSFAAGYHAAFASERSRESRRYRRQARELLRIVGRHAPPGRALDVGCSAGFFLEAARDDGWEPTGVELSPDTARLARRKGLDVLIGTLEQAELEQGSFDLVTMWDVVEHVPDPLPTASAAAALLKEGGLLALSTPNVNGVFPRLSFRASEWTRRWPHPEPPRHLFQFSRATIRLLLDRAGFDVVEEIDRRIPLAYTFGSPLRLLVSPLDLVYAAVFAPVAFAGPLIGSGDDLVVVARKRRSAP